MKANPADQAPSLDFIVTDARISIGSARNVFHSLEPGDAIDAADSILHSAEVQLEQALESIRAADRSDRRSAIPKAGENPTGDDMSGVTPEFSRLIKGAPTEDLANAVGQLVPGALVVSRRRLKSVRGILAALIEEAHGGPLELPEDTSEMLALALETLDAATVSANVGN